MQADHREVREGARGVRSPYRILLAALGVACVGLAIVGAIVPGLPTTVFLILASYLFTRSCPVLERRLLDNRLLRPYLAGIRAGGMTRRAKRLALASMWTAVAASVILMTLRYGFSPWFCSAVVAAAAMGTGMIVRQPTAARGWTAPRASSS